MPPTLAELICRSDADCSGKGKEWAIHVKDHPFKTSAFSRGRRGVPIAEVCRLKGGRGLRNADVCNV